MWWSTMSFFSDQKYCLHNYTTVLWKNVMCDAIPGQWFRRTDTKGTGRKDAEKSQYPAGKHWKSLESGSSIPAGNLRIFFRCILANFQPESIGNWPESTGKNSEIFGRNTASVFLRFPMLSGRFLSYRYDLGYDNDYHWFNFYCYFLSMNE